FDASTSPPYLHSFPTRRSSDLERMDWRSADGRTDPRLQVGACRRRPFREGARPEDSRLRGPLHRRQQLAALADQDEPAASVGPLDRKSTCLNSSHVKISYAVFC